MSSDPHARKIIQLSLLLAVVALLAACSDDGAGTAAVATPTLIPNSFVVLAAPAVDAIVPLDAYGDDADSSAPRTAAIGQAGYAYRGQVCAGIQLDTLVQPNDRLFSGDIDERLSLILDGEARALAPAATQHGGVYGRIESENIEFEGGLNIFCWTAALDLGRHEAELRFRQTSGDFQTFSWSFSIVEGFTYDNLGGGSR